MLGEVFVGKTVLYWPPNEKDTFGQQNGPYPALVAKVHNTAKIDLVYFSRSGSSYVTDVMSDHQRSKGERWSESGLAEP